MFGLPDRADQRFARGIVDVEADEADMQPGAALDNAEQQARALVELPDVVGDPALADLAGLGVCMTFPMREIGSRMSSGDFAVESPRACVRALLPRPVFRK